MWFIDAVQCEQGALALILAQSGWNSGQPLFKSEMAVLDLTSTVTFACSLQSDRKSGLPTIWLASSHKFTSWKSKRVIDEIGL